VTIPAPPLLVDGTAGRLARWLRLRGYDTAYSADRDPFAILRKARAEGRAVVTCNHDLAHRSGVTSVLLESREIAAQLSEIEAVLGRPSDTTPRCTRCNSPLIALSREAAKLRVPPYVWRTCNEFAACPVCRRTYWKGTHWDAISKRQYAVPHK
jgi:hypothetical protein